MHRSEVRARIERALGRAPICYLAGPHQSGKTTLARTFLPANHSAYFDLEDSESESRRHALPWRLDHRSRSSNREVDGATFALK
ncbi:MAG: hypothetical protein WCL50_12135 [Spirochaetota bacterium]